MNILCIGGGPAGLYFALLMKTQNPQHHITVVERNRPYDTFGWGVVFSDKTLENLQQADAPTGQLIADAFNHWDDIEVFFYKRCHFIFAIYCSNTVRARVLYVVSEYLSPNYLIKCL